MSKRKILIISHNPINQFDNMGKTIGNIFSGFSKEELCQLYFKKQNVNAQNLQLKTPISEILKAEKISKSNLPSNAEANNLTTLINHLITKL